MAKLILGIAGEMGSGKEAISKHLVQNYQASAHNFSQILDDILRRIHLEITRENEAPLSLALRKAFGEDVLAKVIYHDSSEDDSEIVVVQGIRRLQDIAYLKQLPHFKFIFVEAEMETRFNRVKKRNEKANDSTMTFEDFKQQHTYETELQIADLKNYAEHVIDNNGNYVELYKQVDEIVKQYIS